MFGPTALNVLEPSLSCVPERRRSARPQSRDPTHRVTRAVALGSVPVPLIVVTEVEGLYEAAQAAARLGATVGVGAVALRACCARCARRW